MHKLLAIMTSVAFLAAATPSATASETVTENYIASVGFYLGPACGNGVTCGLGLVLCPTQPDGSNCDFGGETCLDVDDDGNDDVCETLPSTDIGMEAGGATFLAGAAYQNVAVSSDDAFFGSDAAMSACLWHPDGTNNCGVAPNVRGPVDCGTSLASSLSTDGFYSNDASAFLRTIFVGQDLSVCGASQGQAFATFF